jgi:choline transport protein
MVEKPDSVAELSTDSISLSGWLVALGWQACLAGSCYAAACLLLALVELNIPSYVVENWYYIKSPHAGNQRLIMTYYRHQTLLTIGIALSVTVVNIFLTKLLPVAASIILWLFVAGFVAVGHSAPV